MLRWLCSLEPLLFDRLLAMLSPTRNLRDAPRLNNQLILVCHGNLSFRRHPRACKISDQNALTLPAVRLSFNQVERNGTKVAG